MAASRVPTDDADPIRKFSIDPGSHADLQIHQNSLQNGSRYGIKAFSPKKGLVFAVNGPPHPRPLAPAPPFSWGAGGGGSSSGRGRGRGGQGRVRGIWGGGKGAPRPPIYCENEPLFRRKRLNFSIDPASSIRARLRTPVLQTPFLRLLKRGFCPEVATFQGATEPLRLDDPHPHTPLTPTRF